MSNYSKPYLIPFFLLSLIFFYGCSEDSNPIDINEENLLIINFFYTNDEHGWLEPTNTYNGAAGMMAKWKTDHGYSESGYNLILSGGDMWTGPAISTWYDGESMVEVMNEMNYDAAVIGNHEFDFGQDGLLARAEQSDFPFLAANLKKTSGGYPEFVEPYLIKEIEGVKIGIIGLAGDFTMSINFPDNVAGLKLISYEDALNEIIPLVENEGAEIIVMPTHIPSASIAHVSRFAMDHGITLVGCGHSHDTYLTRQSEMAIFEAGHNLEYYVYGEIKFDIVERRVVEINGDVYENSGSYTPDPGIQQVVNYWTEAVNNDLSEVIGYTQHGIGRHSQEMQNMVTDSWLRLLPYGDISMSNRGGLRQAIEPGPITAATIVGVLPFDNNIVLLKLTGYEVKDVLYGTDLFTGGVSPANNYTLTDGSTMSDNTIYSVLITDYIYSTSEKIQGYDPSPEPTGINWRDPLISWMKSLNTSESDPIENYLDSVLR